MRWAPRGRIQGRRGSWMPLTLPRYHGPCHTHVTRHLGLSVHSTKLSVLPPRSRVHLPPSKPGWRPRRHLQVLLRHFPFPTMPPGIYIAVVPHPDHFGDLPRWQVPSPQPMLADQRVMPTLDPKSSVTSFCMATITHQALAQPTSSTSWVPAT